MHRSPRRAAPLRAAAVLGLASLVITATAGGAQAAQAGQADAVAPLLLADTAEAVDGRYVVVLDPLAAPAEVRGKGAEKRSATAAQRSLGAQAAERARGLGATVLHTYEATVDGYAAELTPSQLAKIRKDPAVAYVEADQVVSVADTQSNATWGLDRIDQRNRPLNGTYVYGPTGLGVKTYIIDTGVLGSHQEFTGRMAAGYTAISDGRGTSDCNGHGTHVAGTVAGTTYGVAKRATVIPVRVLGCNGSGTNSGVIAGIDWVANNASGASVANMSLGGGASQATDDAVQRAVSRGVTMVVAAGNENQNACNVSPARAVNAITVGSTTNTDARSSFSNFGSCVDIFAPGSSITSAWYQSNTQTNTISGTSMASPHVAGAAALYLQTNPTASPATVTGSIVGNSTTGLVTGAGTGSPNRLLYTGYLGGGTTTPPPSSGPCDPSDATYTGSLSSGASTTRPTDYYYSSTSGTHAGCLTGPSGADFDLYLYKWNGSSWVTVASGATASKDETVTYNGTAGYYVWQIRSYSGSGSFTLTTARP
jgi:subtilisin family serine protease